MGYDLLGNVYRGAVDQYQTGGLWGRLVCTQLSGLVGKPLQGGSYLPSLQHNSCNVSDTLVCTQVSMRRSVFPKQFEFGYSARTCATMGWSNSTRKSWIKYWGKWIRQWENPYPCKAGGLAWTGGWLWPETRLHTFTVDVSSGDGVWAGDPTPVQRKKALCRHHTREGGSIKGRLFFADSVKGDGKPYVVMNKMGASCKHPTPVKGGSIAACPDTKLGMCVGSALAVSALRVGDVHSSKSGQVGAVGVRVLREITNTAGTLETNRNWFNEDNTPRWRTNPNWFNEV